MLVYSVLLVLIAVIASCKDVQFPLRLTWGVGAPDGNSREMIFMNGQFPGPQLNLTQGDTVEFYVQNDLPFQVTVHFHGIYQQGTPWSDGTPAISQRPIPPGGSFLYQWTATQYGTYWYHAHYKGHIMDGLYGPIVIQPKHDEPRPFDCISNNTKDINAMIKAEQNPNVVLVSDWTQLTSTDYFGVEKASNLDVYCVDSILVNGKGKVECLPQSELNSLVNPNLAALLNQANEQISDKGCAPMSQAALTQGFTNIDCSKVPDGLQSGCKPTQGSFDVTYVDPANGWASINFISSMNEKSTVVSIDNHRMWIYAVDGHYIQPQLVDTFIIYNGERYSAMVKLDQQPGAYTMRFANNLPDQLIAGYSALVYKGSHTSTPDIKSPAAAINYAGNSVSPNVVEFDTNKGAPFNAPPVSNHADQTFVLNMGRYHWNWQWTLNNLSSYDLYLDDSPYPLLFTDHPETAGNQSLTIRTKYNTWVDIVLAVGLAPANPAQPPHPIHKHGNKGYLIGYGNGSFPYHTVAEAQQHMPQNFNIGPQSPYRDSFTTPPILQQPAWVAFRYHVTDPGAWLLHCHIQTHLDGGMALQIVDAWDKWPVVPDRYLYGNGQGKKKRWSSWWG